MAVDAITVLVSLLGQVLLRHWTSEKLAEPLGEALAKLVASETEKRKLGKEFERLAEKVMDRIRPRLLARFTQEDAVHSSALELLQTALEKSLQSQSALKGKDAEAIFEEIRLTPEEILAVTNATAPIPLYENALKDACLYVSKVVPKLPEYQAMVNQTVLRELEILVTNIDQQLDDIERILRRTLESVGKEERASGVVAEAERYRFLVNDRLNTMQLFGVEDIPKYLREYPLGESFVMLQASTKDTASAHGTLSLEGVLETLSPKNTRVLIKGDAGMGKTTLLKWIAAQSANYAALERWKETERFEPLREQLELGKRGYRHEALECPPHHWSRRIPFYVRLRDCTNGNVPHPDKFTPLWADPLPEPTEHWTPFVKEELKKGALVLIDGVDEVPVEFREASGKHQNTLESTLKVLINDYPSSYFVLTSRPAGIDDDFLKDARLAFRVFSINPLSRGDSEQLIRQWHRVLASALQSSRPDESRMVSESAEKVIEQIRKTQPLRTLALNPLLCAVMCAVHHGKGSLPDSLYGLIEAFLTMLIRTRNEFALQGKEFSREYRLVSETHRRNLLTDLALRMNAQASLSRTNALTVVQAYLPRIENKDKEPITPETVLQMLIERTGVLSELSDRGPLSFLHNQFKEFLIAERRTQLRDIKTLVKESETDTGVNVILFAAVSPNYGINEDLIRALLQKRTPTARLLASYCRRPGLPLDPELAAQLQNCDEGIFPLSSPLAVTIVSLGGDRFIDKLSLKLYPKITDEQQVFHAEALRKIDTPKAQELALEWRDTSIKQVVVQLSYIVDPLLFNVTINAIQSFNPDTPEYVKNISNLDALKELKQLQWLDLNNTQVQNLDALKELKSLVRLDLNNTQVQNLDALKELKQLQWLDLNNTQVQNLDALKELKQLQYLDLNNTQVSKEAVAELKKQLKDVTIFCD